MPLTLVTLTGSLSDLTGSTFDARRTKVWIETNVDNGVIVDTDGNMVRLGDAKVTISDSGAFSFANLVPTNAATNPTAFQYRLWVDYAQASGRERKKWTSGWFSLTATSDLADVVAEQFVPPTYISAVTAQLDQYVTEASAQAERAAVSADEAEAAAQAAEDLIISDLGTTDGQTRALIQAPGSQTAQALSASIEAEVAAEVPALVGTHAAVRDRERMAVLGSIDRNRSQGLARAAFDTAAADTLTEDWSDLDSWTLGTPGGVQVSGGRMYGNGAGGASGLTYGIDLADGETFRAVLRYHPNPADNGIGAGIMVGVSADPGGAVPGGGAGNVRGLYFDSGVAKKWTNGGVDASLGAVDTAATYTVTVTVDERYISVVAVANNGNPGEFRGQWSRVGFAVNSLYLFNSLPDTTFGSIGTVQAHPTLASFAPRLAEGAARTVHWTRTPDGVSGVKILLPPDYDSRVPAPVAMCYHGNGGDEHLYTDNMDVNATRVANTLVEAGYIVVTAAYTPHLGTWGAQESLDAYAAAYAIVRDHYAIGPVVIHADSMGGIESLLVIAQRKVPGIVAWFGSVPSANLRAAYDNPEFTTTIQSAYGIAADGSDYAAKTAGHDPALIAGDMFRSLPMAFYPSDDDVVLDRTLHTDVLAPKVAPYSAQLAVAQGLTGGHGSAAAFPEATILAFFREHAGG